MRREMKDSGIEWIGEIPKDWEVGKVKKYYTMQTGFTPDTKNELYYDDNGIEWVNISDMNDGKTIFKTKKKVSELYINIFQPILIPEGSLLYSFKLSVGQTAYTGKPMYSNEAIASFLPNDSVNLHFLRYSSMFIIENAQTNIYNAKIMNQELIKNAYVIFPPINEQQHIADFLDEKCREIDSVLECTRTSIEEYKKLKQAVITQAVTKGVCGNRPMKDSGYEFIGQIPKNWNVTQLRYIATLQNGISKGGEFFGKGYPFVSYSDVYKNMVLPKQIGGLVESTDEERKRYSVQVGDIFFTRTSETIEEVGFSSVCLETIPNATFAGFLIRVRPNIENLDIHFSKYYFRSNHHRKYLVKQMNLVTRASLGQTLLKGMPVLLPQLEEQREIADYLDTKCAEIDNLITKKQQYLIELENYKKSLIYEYVTGKQEVFLDEISE